MGIACYREIAKNFPANPTNITLMRDMVALHETFASIKVTASNLIMLYSTCKSCIDLGGYSLTNDRVSKALYRDLPITKKDHDRKTTKYVAHAHTRSGKLMIT